MGLKEAGSLECYDLEHEAVRNKIDGLLGRTSCTLCVWVLHYKDERAKIHKY